MLVQRDELELNSIFRRERTELDGEGLWQRSPDPNKTRKRQSLPALTLWQDRRRLPIQIW